MAEDDKRIDERRCGTGGAKDHGHLWVGRMWEDSAGYSLHERVQVEVSLYT
jgi:hypothetical protein